MSTQQNSTPAALIGVVLGVAGLIVVVIICVLVQARRRAFRDRTVSSVSKEKASPQANAEKLQHLESLCPTRSCEEWVENSRVEQDLSDGASASFICSMCLDEVAKSDMMHVLACRHVYHARCLEQWFLAEHVRCPLCNQIFFHDTQSEATPV